MSSNNRKKGLTARVVRDKFRGRNPGSKGSTIPGEISLENSVNFIDNYEIIPYIDKFTVKNQNCWRSSTAEQLICNQQVMGSNPFASSGKFFFMSGGVPEWPKGTDCKSVGSAFGGSNPPPTRIMLVTRCGRSSVVEPQPSKLITWVQFPSPAFH